jgi:hypothetical protein
VSEQKLSTTAKALREVFVGMPRCRIGLETGMHSPWVSRILTELGHEVIVAHARSVRLIGRESEEGRSAGCANPGADRSPVAVSGEASQRASAGGFDSDPGASRTGAGQNGAGEHGPWIAKSYGERLRVWFRGKNPVAIVVGWDTSASKATCCCVSC